MSRYEWERGTLKIPTKEWTGLKKAVREEYNRVAEAQYAYCTKLYTHLIGLKASDKAAYEQQLQEMCWGNGPELGTRHDWQRSNAYLVYCRGMDAPKRPQRKDFPIATNYSTIDEGKEWRKNSTGIMA
jgi:hypothetical protein